MQFKQDKSALLITDSYNNYVNGISVFSKFFIQDYLSGKYSNVLVLEVSTMTVFQFKMENSSEEIRIDDVFVNANFSASDYLVRNKDFISTCIEQGIKISPGFKKILISHGWPSIRFRLNYYGLYYAVRNFMRSRNLDRLRFYDDLIFISKVSDPHRHCDHTYAVEQSMTRTYYDFSSRFLDSPKSASINNETGFSGRILVIANFEHVKNLWWVLRCSYKRQRAGRQHQFTILMKERKGLMYKLFEKIAIKNGVVLVFNQEKKNNLLKSCSYLFIPSYSEYNPIVAIEAASFGKNVVSLFRIEALVGRKGYHYLTE